MSLYLVNLVHNSILNRERVLRSSDESPTLQILRKTAHQLFKAVTYKKFDQEETKLRGFAHRIQENYMYSGENPVTEIFKEQKFREMQPEVIGNLKNWTLKSVGPPVIRIKV